MKLVVMKFGGSSVANAEKIKAELQRTEANRLEVLNQANTQAMTNARIGFLLWVP